MYHFAVLVRLHIEHDIVIILKKFITQLVHSKLVLFHETSCKEGWFGKDLGPSRCYLDIPSQTEDKKLPSRRPVRTNPAYVSNTLKTLVSLVMISLVRSPLLSN